MARSVNQVILLGRLTRDPEERSTQTGKKIVTFSIAVDKPGKDAGAEFYDITAWEKLGELVTQYLSKGRPCLVFGRLRQDSWTDKDTQKKRTKIGITATDITFLPSGGKASEGGDAAAASGREDVVIEDIDDDPIDLSEIPF